MGDYEYELDVTLTRGEGASDRDRQKVTVGANDLEALDEKVRELQKKVREWADGWRAIQPPEGPQRQLADDQTDLDEVPA